MILGSVQPSYLSWIPLFHRMKMADVFVHLDDVKYSKNSFHNRNRIKTANGPLVLTVPVRYSGNSQANICDIPPDNSKDWREKHWKTIELSYKKAPYFADLAPKLKQIYEAEWNTLGDLNICLIELFREYLGITTPCYRSSAIPVEGEANEKLVNLCKRLGADTFIVKPNTNDYHPKDFFESRGIKFAYFDFKSSPYSQMHGAFEPNLSILDYAMNCGPGSL